MSDRDTLPAPPPDAWDGAPSWALAMRHEMQELSGALRECSRLVVIHTRELQRLELSQRVLEHRQNELQEHVAPVIELVKGL